MEIHLIGCAPARGDSLETACREPSAAPFFEIHVETTLSGGSNFRNNAIWGFQLS